MSEVLLSRNCSSVKSLHVCVKLRQNQFLQKWNSDISSSSKVKHAIFKVKLTLQNIFCNIT